MIGKKIAKQIVPPIIWRAGSYLFGKCRVIREWPRETKEGWHRAVVEASLANNLNLNKIRKGLAIGLSSERASRSWIEDDLGYHNLLIQFGSVAGRVGARSESLRILDYGGAFGAHAVALARLSPHLSFRYTVCELPEFCAVGRTVNRDVRFVSDLSQAGTGYHLVYASSSIQYSHDWRSLVPALCNASIGCVLVTKTPFVFNSEGFLFEQRAYGTKYPGWVFNFDEFVNQFIHNGMKLKEVFINGPGLPIKGSRERNILLGLLFEKDELAIQSK